jgi:putative ABC transport system permease protein
VAAGGQATLATGPPYRPDGRRPSRGRPRLAGALRLNWALNSRHLAAHRLRLALSIAGIASGVALAVAVGGLTSSINAALQNASLAAATKANLEVRPLTQISFPATALIAARATPGVTAAAGTVEATTYLRPAGGGPELSVALIGFEPGILALAPRSLAGANLAHADLTGLLLPASLAERLEVSGRQRFEIYTPGGWAPTHLGGLLPPSPGGSQVAATGLLTAQTLLGRAGRLDALYIRTGPDAAAARAALAARLGPSLRIGPLALRTDDVRQITATVSVVLNVAAIVALFVGAFLVYNTMSMASVERAGEAAILRAVGARRRQTFWLLVAEGALLGAAGSLAGLVAGLGLARVLLAIRGAGLEDLLPVSVDRLVLSWSSLLLAGVGGVLASMAAAAGPARRVARADPAANLGPRAALEEPAGVGGWRPIPVGLVLVGVGAVVAGYWVHAPTSNLSLPTGAMFLFVAGVAVLVRPLVPALAGRLLRPARRSGPTLRLAAGELQRSPARTAYTVGAVVLALALVVGVQVDIASFQSAFDTGLSQLIQADLIVASRDWAPYGASVGLSAGAATQIAALPGVAAAYPSKTLLTSYRGHITPVLAISAEGYRRYATDPALSPHDRAINAAMEVTGRILISDSAVGRFGLKAGQPLTLNTPAGPRIFTIAGVYDDPTAVLPTFYVTYEDAQAAWGLDVADVVDVFLDPGVSRPAVIAEIRRSLGPRYGLTPDTREAFIAQLAGIVSSLQRLIGSVQVVAVVVAALGVANTLLISTFERRRDLGILRAVGMNRRQLRRMVVTESLLLGILGVALAWLVGTGVGLFAHKITEIQTGLRIPTVIQPLAYLTVLGLGIAAAVGAALYPAQRAATIDVTEALQYE